jgi:hypothetical protein
MLENLPILGKARQNLLTFGHILVLVTILGPL